MSSTIPLRPFGRHSDVRISALGLGGHHLGGAADLDTAIRIVHRAEGWTPEAIAAHAAPALQAAFMPLDTSEQAFPWDPV